MPSRSLPPRQKTRPKPLETEVAAGPLSEALAVRAEAAAAAVAVAQVAVEAVAALVAAVVAVLLAAKAAGVLGLLVGLAAPPAGLALTGLPARRAL